MKIQPAFLFVGVLLSCLTPAQTMDETPAAVALRIRKADAESRALFQSADTLSLTLEANFGSVKGDRDPESTKVYPATVKITTANKGTIAIPVQISVRGNFRRK